MNLPKTCKLATIHAGHLSMGGIWNTYAMGFLGSGCWWVWLLGPFVVVADVGTKKPKDTVGDSSEVEKT